MFFLKDLPTREMVEGYASRFAPGESDAILDVLHELRDASLLIRRLDDYFARHDFSQLRFLVLIVIDREPERTSLSHGELAERLDVSKPVLTRTLKCLTEEGFLRSSSSQHDKRARLFRLTRAARHKLSALLPDYFSLLTDHAPGSPAR